MANKVKKSPTPLVGRNATDKIIERSIPASELPTKNPSLAIQKIVAKHKNIMPTPVPVQ